MRRLVNLQIAAAVVCAASLLASPAAQARTLFDASSGDLETAAVVTPSHLPAWVQAALTTVPVYAADSGSEVTMRLPLNTFMRVLGAGTSRLQVQTYDDSGNPNQTGWVNANQVLPSAAGTGWLVTSAATTLWGTDDGGADALRSLDPFTPLQQFGGPLAGRVQVNVFRSDFSAVVDQGWVDASSTGPALPPQMRVPSPSERAVALRNPGGSAQQQAFLDATAQAARDAALLTGVPASVTVAQAILESDWGRSALAVSANNYFGIKAMGTLGSDGVVYMPTSEYDASGELFQTVDAFRAYKSLTDSLADHDRLLQTAPRYALAMKSANDPRQFAALLAQAGYSTDPDYAAKLVALMDRYNLYQLDA